VGPRLAARLASTGGNPGLVTELVVGLDAEGLLRRREGRIELAALPGGGHHLPPGVRGWVRDRLSEVPDAGRHALRLAALLGTRFRLTDLAAALARPPLGLLADLEPAITSGLIDTGDPEAPAFAHPLVREVLADHLPAALRTAAHRAIADALLAAGRPLDVVAPHLARAADRGDPGAARALRLAGVAAGGASPTAAVTLLEQARAVAGQDRRAEAAADASLAVPLVWVGRPGDARARGEAALGARCGLDPASAASAQLGLVRALAVDGRFADAAARAEQAAAAGGVPAPARAELLAEAAMARLLSGAVDEADALARRAADEAEAAGSAPALSAAACTLALHAGLRGRFADALSQGRRAVAIAEADPSAAHRHPHFFLGLVELDADRSGDAVRTLARGRAAGARLGTLWDLPLYRWLAALGHYHRGDWDRAQDELDAGLEEAEARGTRAALLWSQAFAALLAVERDDPVRAAAARARAHAEVERIGPQYGYEWLLLADALASEAAGDLPAAVRAAAEAWAVDEALGLVSELRLLGPYCARLAAAARDHDLAAAVVARMDEARDRTGLASFAGAALLCRGIATGDPDTLLAAVDAYRGAPRPVEQARAAEEAAVALAAAGRAAEARAAHAAARAVYARAGAQRAISRAAARLRAHGLHLGVRGPRPAARARAGEAALTAAEHRILALLRDGHSNPEIADRLFVSRRTVETHVSHILGKLGATSRRELVTAPR
jgi:DNA-binding CsgD family transcriptional regulator